MTDQQPPISGSNTQRIRFPGLTLLRTHLAIIWLLIRAAIAGSAVIVVWAAAWWAWIMPFLQESFGAAREMLLWFWLFATIYILYLVGARYRLQLAQLQGKR